MIRGLAERGGIDTILHVGDFGICPGASGRRYRHASVSEWWLRPKALLLCIESCTSSRLNRIRGLFAADWGQVATRS